MQLAPYFEIFARDQIKTLSFEELINKTEPTMTAIFRWLKVDPSATFETVPPKNVTPETIEQRRGGGLLSDLRDKNPLLRIAIDSTPESARRFARRLVSRKITRLRVDTSEIAGLFKTIATKADGRTDAIAWTRISRMDYTLCVTIVLAGDVSMSLHWNKIARPGEARSAVANSQAAGRSRAVA
jgi:hypothetical protein